ncbi:DUF1998 domain-containing protein [Clostridium sp. C8-1-8]|uniref:DUF1998 domain-containing protein n=1 Tax=Clostridium sp. C8-1-8 TaxID=2698831 RepID=UPI00136AD7BB|nr:DUF1998 domain-containing protein [Clostridium sp. C8-1-8]
MKRSKHQAVYKYLPGVWTGYTDDKDPRLGGNSVTIKINTWNYRNLEGVFTDRIEAEILRNINIFERRGGNIQSFFLKSKDNFAFVEPATAEDFEDIRGEVSPLVFYCSNCGSTLSLSNSNYLNKNTWTCQLCNTRSVKQLQMVYTCECGSAVPVKLPYKKINGKLIDYKYWPVGVRNAYKFVYKVGKSEKPEEMKHKCDCGEVLLPRNASDNVNFRALNIKTIKLMDEKQGKFYKNGLDAKKIIIAYWLALISESKFKDILNNMEFFKENDNISEMSEEFKKKVKDFMDLFGIDEEQAIAGVKKMAKKGDDNKNSYIQQQIASSIPNIGIDVIEVLASQLLEYDTLKNAIRTITLEEAIEKQKSMKIIKAEEEIHNINKKFGIYSAQVSHDVEVITSTYGFTRRKVDPKQSSAKTGLGLKSFRNEKEGRNLVYTAKLETEGILIEFDKVKIINWLYDNKFIDDSKLPDLEDETIVKKWYLENVKCSEITSFNHLDKNNPESSITHYIYTLLHSISHAFIKSAGSLSGLDKNSLSEIILPNTCSIFIYANTAQGVPLGSLSGMFEQNYKMFLRKAQELMQRCVFDPICSDRDNASCSSCTQLSEVCCCHFNMDLTRKYVIGVKSKTENIKGFWEF